MSSFPLTYALWCLQTHYLGLWLPLGWYWVLLSVIVAVMLFVTGFLSSLSLFFLFL